MATKHYEDEQISISADDARGGVTGHNVRYVLGFGLTGIILAFAGLGVYFGYDALSARFSEALSQNPYDVVRAFAPYAAVAFVGAIIAGLLLGFWNAMSGGSDNATQSGMRLRVVAQFAIVCAIMAIFYVTGG